MRTRSELADAVAAEEERLRNEHREAGERRESLHRAAVRQARIAAEAESSANSDIIAEALAVRSDEVSQPTTVDDPPPVEGEQTVASIPTVPENIQMAAEREAEEDISMYSQEQVDNRIAQEARLLADITRKANDDLAAARAAVNEAILAERQFIAGTSTESEILERENEMTRVAAATAAASPMLTPGQAMTGVLNYSINEHRKFFERATRRLMPEHELFDISQENIQDFIDLLSSRCADNDWSDTINRIQVEDTADSPRIPLLTNYGELTIDQVRMHELKYIASGTRNAQNAKMMYNCIYSSLSQEGRSKIAADKNKYILYIGGHPYESGNLLFKTVVSKSVLSTNGLSRHLNGQIARLDEYLIEVKYDIEKLHTHVNAVTLKLQAIGQKPYDLKRHLINAYETVRGNDFEHYIMRIGDDVDQAVPGTAADITPQELMEKVQNKYTSMLLAKKWNVRTGSTDEVLALKAELKKFKKQMASGRGGREKPKGRPTRGPRKGPKPNRDKLNSEAKFNSLKRVKPEDPKNDHLEHNGKIFKWCGEATGGKCEMYVRHSPKQCKGMTAKEDRKPPPKKMPKKYGTMVVKAAEAYKSDGDDSDDDVSMDDNA